MQRLVEADGGWPEDVPLPSHEEISAFLESNEGQLVSGTVLTNMQFFSDDVSDLQIPPISERIQISHVDGTHDAN